ncbi:aldehyde dehydrogenase family protein [Pajaroellobacter abortibovis]|uniref:Aldehyde dehydrogenase domain-containing protein n=1 Tax=Pajaroellobacter abortibovis TaxID=1882918 RepID=A0A1L6MVU3_9BACT|nr:aldehyde dehydrogenase family protein [Pajaroellobacter abortibovis]APR99663.1 hypothetical protein BCY86_02460 [Pajaroellobacter abortibovis]
MDAWSGEDLAQVVLAGDREAGQAVVTAVAASACVRQMITYKRSDLLLRIASLRRERREEFAVVIARETGKPIRLACIEVGCTISGWEKGAEEVSRERG